MPFRICLRDDVVMGRLCAVLLVSVCLWAGPADDARRTLTEAAHSKEGDQRKEAALSLSLVPAKDPVVALIDDMLTDSDYLVRVAAIDTLGELNDKSRLPLLRAALSDDVPEVAFAAAKALYVVRDPAGAQALESIYQGETKGRSSFFKKGIRDSWRRLKTPRSAFLFAVQNGVGFVPVPGVGAGYNALLGVLTDSEFSARAVSLLTVCTAKSKTCDDMLSSSFQDEDWTVRAAGVHLVAIKNVKAMKPKLADLIKDKKNKVRLRAAAGYLRMEANQPAKPLAVRTTKKVS